MDINGPGKSWKTHIKRSWKVTENRCQCSVHTLLLGGLGFSVNSPVRVYQINCQCLFKHLLVNKMHSGTQKRLEFTGWDDADAVQIL